MNQQHSMTQRDSCFWLWAIKEQNCSFLLQDLLDHGENANMQDENLTAPLIWAAGHGHVEIVEELVTRGDVVSYHAHDLISNNLIASGSHCSRLWGRWKVRSVENCLV